MRLRLASIAFLLGSVSTGVAWLTLQPALVRLIELVRRTAPPGSAEAELLLRVRGLLPYSLALDLVIVTLLCYGALHLTVGAPLRRTEEAVAQLTRLELEAPLRPTGGPLLSRLQRSLAGLARALQEEQALTQRQLEELRAKNQQLSKTRTELLAAERLATVGRLAAGVAHEVGNPLSGILGYVSVARTKSKSPEVSELLERIDAEVHRIDQIVRGLLDLGRPAKGRPIPVELKALVEPCVKLLAAGKDFAQVKVEVDLEPGTTVHAEPGPLSQVLINLLLNAAQAMGGRGTVVVRSTGAEGRRCIEVIDEGPGIPPEVLPKLFDPFFTTKEAGEGTGLGLAISHHLVTSMGGTLTADNGERGGARFTIALPG